MAENSDVVDRADSLMRRRRSFVATQPATPPAPLGMPQPVAEDDDIPVLTEVISAEAAVSEGSTNRVDETQITLLASDLAEAIGQQLTYELPTLLEAVLINAGEELRLGITATMETALRDYIARRKQLRLPLEEPNDSD
ncbi:MAG: hypothetical protein KA779_00890 [Propionivibrio sp.]|nr:hypothetical protein [Propionivibrio sp.]MBP7523299.1 hypothetical protein [Propionivibrio sp.]